MWVQGGQRFHPTGRGEEEERQRKAGAEEGSEQVSEQVPLRGMKGRKPMITIGNEQAGIAAAPTDTER